MSLLSRFEGYREDDDAEGSCVANQHLETTRAYHLLFPEQFDLNADALTLALRGYHPDLANAEAEIFVIPQEHRDDDSPLIIGLMGWGDHVVKFAGFDAPVSAKVYEGCVAPSHIAPQLKEDARGHRSHILLYYAGYDQDALEQFVALTVAAVAFSRFDAILLLNEPACSAFPAEALLADEEGIDPIDALRQLPIPLIYGGFIKLEVEDVSGVWMRTCGNRLLLLPDLAMLTAGHEEGGRTFDLFTAILAYLRDSGTTFAEGHTMQVGEAAHLKLRAPTEAEWFLQSDGEMFVLEMTTETHE